ncbi:MAG: hypothetical protein V2B13_11905 [Pseudomonadota bacterium]
MSKEYKIETIHDCMGIPLDRFNLFLDEFNEVLMFARATHEVNRVSSGIENPTTIKSFTWIDDDKGEIRVKVTPVPRTPLRRE